MVLTEANIAVLCDHMLKNVEWRYPLTSGATQYDFNPGTGIQVIRRGEPITKEYPTIVVNFEGSGTPVHRGLQNVLKEHSGSLVYGYGELNPLIITVYTNLETRGTLQTWHGKLVSAAYRDRVDRYMRRYWPQLLEGMEAYIYNPFSWVYQDLSNFLDGTEMQGWELTMNLVSTRKWDFAVDGYQSTGEAFEDAHLFMAETGQAYEETTSISGYMSTAS